MLSVLHDLQTRLAYSRLRCIDQGAFLRHSAAARLSEGFQVAYFYLRVPVEVVFKRRKQHGVFPMLFRQHAARVTGSDIEKVGINEDEWWERNWKRHKRSVLKNLWRTQLRVGSDLDLPGFLLAHPHDDRGCGQDQAKRIVL